MDLGMEGAQHLKWQVQRVSAGVGRSRALLVNRGGRQSWMRHALLSPLVLVCVLLTLLRWQADAPSSGLSGNDRPRTPKIARLPFLVVDGVDDAGAATATRDGSEEAARQAQKEQAEAEKQRQKELAELARKNQKEAAEELVRKQKELDALEQEAVTKASLRAKRPLNLFEERRVRRQVRSEMTGGLPSSVESKQRDWTQTLKPEVKGQLDDAVDFFSETMRVPATLIGSAALSTLFIPPFKWGFLKDEVQEQTYILLWRLYVLLTAATFCMELTCVLLTSRVHAQLLELGRSGLALEPTAMDLIMSHMEFEYLTCSLSYFGGVVAFMLATFCRVLAVFRFSKSDRMSTEPELCVIVGGMMLSSLLWWIHLANVRLIEFNNLGLMVMRFVQLLWARMRLGEVGIVGMSALLIGLVSAAATIPMLLSGKGNHQIEKRAA